MVILCFFFFFFKAEQLSIITKHLTFSRFPLHTTDSSSPTLHLFCPLLSVSDPKASVGTGFLLVGGSCPGENTFIWFSSLLAALLEGRADGLGLPCLWGSPQGSPSGGCALCG